MQSTPKSLRLHIGLFGRRNVGKSSLLKAITRQQVSIVSAYADTTTDPVEKPLHTFLRLLWDRCVRAQGRMDMIGIGPYLASPGTPLEGALGEALRARAGTDQTPGDPLTTLKGLALGRTVGRGAGTSPRVGRRAE